MRLFRRGTPPTVDPDGRPAPAGLAELTSVSVGGETQWILVRGRQASQPLLLVLHGGPGGAYIGVARSYFGALEAEWTVVNWDERAAGLSYRRSVRGERLTADRIADDAVDLADQLRRRYPERPLLLLGHSLGTLLAPYVLERAPTMFDGYVAVSQAVLDEEAERESYDWTLGAARRAGWAKALTALTEIGRPPYRGGPSESYTRAEYTDRLGGAYLGSSGAAAAYRALRRGTEYTWFDLLFRLLPGIRYWSGHIDASLSRVNVLERFPRLPVPTLFVQGRQDWMTPWASSRRYYERLTAPRKSFATIEGSAHYPFAEQPQAFVAALEWVRPGNPREVRTAPVPPGVNP